MPLVVPDMHRVGELAPVRQAPARLVHRRARRRMFSNMKSIAVCFALVLSACAPMQTTPPPDDTRPGVRLHAERTSNGVRLTLDNGEREPIGYNLCISRLQRQSAGGWTDVETGEVCTMHMATLNPGADATFAKLLPGNLPAGEYRYVTGVESPVGTAQKPVASNSFHLP